MLLVDGLGADAAPEQAAVAAAEQRFVPLVRQALPQQRRGLRAKLLVGGGRGKQRGSGQARHLLLRVAEHFGEAGIAAQDQARTRKQDADGGIVEDGLLLQHQLARGLLGSLLRTAVVEQPDRVAQAAVGLALGVQYIAIRQRPECGAVAAAHFHLALERLAAPQQGRRLPHHVLVSRARRVKVGDGQAHAAVAIKAEAFGKAPVVAQHAFLALKTDGQRRVIHHGLHFQHGAAQLVFIAPMVADVLDNPYRAVMRIQGIDGAPVQTAPEQRAILAPQFQFGAVGLALGQQRRRFPPQDRQCSAERYSTAPGMPVNWWRA